MSACTAEQHFKMKAVCKDWGIGPCGLFHPTLNQGQIFTSGCNNICLFFFLFLKDTL